MTAALPILLALAATAADPPAGSVAYYLGESRVSSADGQALGVLVSLMKREQVPGESKIVETTLMVSSRAGEPVKEYVAVFAVTGAKFTVTEQGGAFDGEGDLAGPAWAWTSRSTTTRIPGARGGTLLARERPGERGLAVSKELSGDDGGVRVRFAEDYATIDGATYEILREKLLPKPEGPRR